MKGFKIVYRSKMPIDVGLSLRYDLGGSLVQVKAEQPLHNTDEKQDQKGVADDWDRWFLVPSSDLGLASAPFVVGYFVIVGRVAAFFVLWHCFFYQLFTHITI